MSEIIVQATYALHAYIPLHHAVKAGQPRLCGSVSATKIVEIADILHFVPLPDVLLTLLNLSKKRACHPAISRDEHASVKKHTYVLRPFSRVVAEKTRAISKSFWRHFRKIYAPNRKTFSAIFYMFLAPYFRHYWLIVSQNSTSHPPTASLRSFGSCPKQ